MKVLAAVVVPPHLAVSGAARAAESLSEALGHHCEITVASMLSGGGGDAPGQAVPAGGVGRARVRTWLPPGLDLRGVPRKVRTLFYRSSISEIVRSGSYDLVHIHNPMPALEMRRIARTCRSLGIPYVVSTHGFNEIANGVRIYAFGRAQAMIWRRLVDEPVREVVAGAARIFALSPQDAPIVEAMGQSAENIVLVGNGVPVPEAGDAAADAALLDRFNILPRDRDARPTFLFLANHTPNKGLPVLLAAFRRLQEPFQLIVGGDRRPGIDYPRDDRNAAQRIVVTGRLTQAEVAACFRRADVFVFPTLADTFPLVVLEAMSNGLPVIASKVGGIPHQIGGDHGILVEPGDPDGLAAALRALMNDPERASRLGAAARKRAGTEFTWERAAATAHAAYAAALAAGVAGPSTAKPH